MGSNTDDTISDVDLIRLETRFVLPVIIDAMLKDEEVLDDVAEHAIHEMLDELYPDAAVLCLALCAKRIAHFADHIVITKALSIEASHIIDDYADAWLDEMKSKDLSQSLDHDEMLDKLMHLPEDLEALADLFEATIDALNEDHAIPSILSDILAEQARSHQVRAETTLASLAEKPDLPAHLIDTGEKNSLTKDNVIQFPIKSTKH